MSVLDLTVDEARARAHELVRREEYRIGSRMLAYENVGQLIGKSGMWVRRFVKGYAEVVPSLPVAMSIVALHERICERAEQLADRLESADATAPSTMANSKGAVAPPDEG